MANFASHLWLYSGVPLDNTYEHTYASVDKLSYKKWAKPPAPMYYIRPDKNTVRIKHDGNMWVANLPLYECNYLKFSNNSYEGIDFYCFVTEVRYINDETAEIDFEIDVMMTWVASGLVTFEQCFVERETTNSDEIGEHILEEPVDVGDYIYKDGERVNLNLKFCIGIGGIYENGDWTESGAITYTMNGLKIIDGVSRFVFNADGTTYDMFGNNPFANCTQLITNLVTNGGKLDWIKYAYYFPSSNNTHFISRSAYSGIGENFNYTPKNNKLWTYPYYGVTVNTHEGTTVDLAFELSDTDGVINFKCDSSVIDASASLKVTGYKKGELNCIVTKSKFPVLSCASQEYTGYMANLKAQAPSDVASNVLMPAVSGALFGSSASGIGGVAGAVIGGGVGLLNYILQAYSAGEQAKLKGSTPIGTNSGMLQVANNTTFFDIYFKTIRTEYARAIDDFFTKFGYKVNRLKIPSKYTSGNRTLSWHYIKTIGCAIEGKAPASAVSKIQNIMDNGITFWNKPEIGQYTFPS